MGCRPFAIKTDKGVVSGFVCTRGRHTQKCADCSRVATALCDWKLRGALKGKTCSRPMCGSHGTNVAPGKDLCAAHARMWAMHPANPKNKPVVGQPESEDV